MGTATIHSEIGKIIVSDVDDAATAVSRVKAALDQCDGVALETDYTSLERIVLNFYTGSIEVKTNVNSSEEIHKNLPHCFAVLAKYYGTDEVITMLEGIDLSDAEDAYTSFSPETDIIWGSFNWSNSPQGHEFWSKVASFVESKQI